MIDPRADDAKARGRFLVINILRLSGVGFVIAAMLILSDKIALPQIVGWALLAVGMTDIFVVPQLLARAWRTPLP